MNKSKLLSHWNAINKSGTTYQQVMKIDDQAMKKSLLLGYEEPWAIFDQVMSKSWTTHVQVMNKT